MAPQAENKDGNGQSPPENEDGDNLPPPTLPPPEREPEREHERHDPLPSGNKDGNTHLPSPDGEVNLEGNLEGDHKDEEDWHQGDRFKPLLAFDKLRTGHMKEIVLGTQPRIVVFRWLT